MNNHSYETRALAADLRNIEESATCGWINCLDADSLGIVEIAVEAWNEYCMVNGWDESIIDFESYGCEKIEFLSTLAESIEDYLL